VSRITVTLGGSGECEVLHAESGARIHTSKSALFGGTGRSVSSTDLLSAALGTCIATDLEPVADRHGLPLEQIRIEVDKQMTVSPRKIVALTVDITLPDTVDDLLRLKLERTAQHCLVHRSLSPEIEVSITVRRAHDTHGSRVPPQ
jgi:uncharacterized OsmC-like protein